MKKNLIQIFIKKNNNKHIFEKKEIVHKKGILHIAVSIFIFNEKNNLMLQKRSKNKYHSSLLWTNTCCSHIEKDENIYKAAHRCLKNEMGFDCMLEYKFFFKYKSKMDKGLIENELDYVFIGNYNNSPKINLDEVDSWKWISIFDLYENIIKYPNLYSVWLKIIMNNHLNKLKK